MELRKEPQLFVKLGFTDMRKQINGLALLIQQLRPEGPFGGAYYLFCGKTRRVIKILYWDRNGFCLWQKRLEQDHFPWPKEDTDFTEVTRQKIRMLLTGIDIWKEHKELKYKLAG
jgi:transposase